jgi:hypothetical protein
VPAPGSWEAFYQSDLQALWLQIAIPALFLLRMLGAAPPATGGAEPRRAAFVASWARLFALETVLDPVMTGPLTRVLGLPAAPVQLAFVLLGDFRVFLLVLVVARPERALGNGILAAARWTLVVPVFAWLATPLVRALGGPASDLLLWLVYETAFVALALTLRQRLVPRWVGAERAGVRRYLRAILAYVATYYALWGTADALILFAGLDAGWGLRVVPNLLYYALWVPFAYELFFSRRYVSSSSAVQTVR